METPLINGGESDGMPTGSVRRTVSSVDLLMIRGASSSSCCLGECGSYSLARLSPSLVLCRQGALLASRPVSRANPLILSDEMHCRKDCLIKAESGSGSSEEEVFSLDTIGVGVN